MRLSFLFRMFVCFSFFTSTMLVARPTWNFFIYMEPTYDLYSAALKNMNDLAKNTNGQANVFVLLHGYEQEAWLYKLEKGIIRQLMKVSVEGCPNDGIMRSMKYVNEVYCAEKLCFVLWNHGYGILVPQYNEILDEWEIDFDEYIDAATCDITRKCRRFNNDHKNHKGMLINAEDKKCYTNEEMVDLFRQLYDLRGKKVDVCGLDMCKGSMVEHAYQLREYIDFMVGSQECELADGWPYDLIMKKLSQNPHMNGGELAKTVINMYQVYYQQKTKAEIFTQSASDVSKISELKNAIDRVSESMLALVEDPLFVKLIRKARNRCRPFCDAPMYVDLHCFLSYLVDECSSYSRAGELFKRATYAQQIIADMIIANATGKRIVNDARGISIYFPFAVIDRSYVDIPFAQDSKWFSFIKWSTENLKEFQNLVDFEVDA